MGCDSFWGFLSFFIYMRNSTFLAKSLNHSVQDYQFTVSFLPSLRRAPHSCSAYGTCLNKLGILWNFHDHLGGRSRFLMALLERERSHRRAGRRWLFSFPVVREETLGILR